MRSWIAAMLLLAASAWPALAAEPAPPSEADKATIRQIIEQQIEAFRADDGERAFGYASPGVQAMFGTPDNFMAMVRSGYPSVYRPRHIEFRELQQRGGRLIQPVLVIGPDGVPMLALYVMDRQPDGRWRIDGCRLAALDDKAAWRNGKIPRSFWIG